MLRLRYFAAVREALGRAGETVEVAAAPRDVSTLLAAIAGAEAIARDRLRIAVNGEIQDLETPLALRDGDEIALLPPVTGG